MDYYASLGIPPFSDDNTIKRAYRHLAKQHHPDVGGSKAKFQLLQEAYEFLVDPSQKQVYDDRLRQEMAERTKIQAYESDYCLSDKIDAIISWAETKPKFDASLVHIFADILAEGRELTERQEQVVDNIIRGFKIDVEKWL